MAKPTAGTRPNMSLPICDGLVGCWLFNEGTGTGTKELVGNNDPTATANLTWSTDSNGDPCGVFNGTSTNLTYAGVAASGPAISIVWMATIANTGANLMIIERSNVNEEWLMYFAGGPLLFRGVDDNRWSSAIVSGGVVADTWYTSAYTDDGYSAGAIGSNTHNNLYNAGSISGLTNAVADNTCAAATNSTNNIHLGNYDGSGFWYSGSISYIYLYNRVLSGTEVSSLYSDPYQIFGSASSGTGSPAAMFMDL